ncbi:hypothetical protein BJX76DRAFT_353766 [Aspergillus varians]
MSSPPIPNARSASPETTISKDEPPATIRCTFSNCKLFFNTVQAMKKHKSTSPAHEYCTKCDLDCETEDHLIIHKIKSTKHIVCPICGIDFGSDSGRDRHIRLFHRTAQNLSCHGCKSTFRSAAGLMRHIEDGECTEISQDRLLFEQSKKLMRKEALEITQSAVIASLVDRDDEDPDGGIELHTFLGERNREAMANQPKQEAGDGEGSKLIDEHWPKLEANETGLEKTMSELMWCATVSSSKSDNSNDNDNNKEKENTGWKGKGREPSVASPSGAGTTSSVGGGGASVVSPPDAKFVLEKMYKDWDANNFFDEFTAEYVCACGKRCRTKEGFEKHVLAKSQGGRRMQCPGCLRIFKSTAAIIAHWESATTRCDVNEGHLYAQIMDEVSGGLIQIAGYNEDGTMKYEAGEVELTETTTVGVDLDKIGW